MNWTPPPGYHPPQQPPPRSPAATIAWGLAILVVTVGVIAVGVQVIDQKADRQDVSLKRAVADAVAVDPPRDVRELPRVSRPPIAQAPREDPAVTKARIAKARFTSQRMDPFDGQCKGKGLPVFAYLIEGSTYSDNVIVGAAVDCVPFGHVESNTTNMFCCRKKTVPASFTAGP